MQVHDVQRNWREIQGSWGELLESIRNAISVMSGLTEKAKYFAFEVHNAIGQTRLYTGDPWTTHVESVADIVAGVVDDEVTIAAAYLHDVVEDTPVKTEDVEEAFGADVAHLVMCMTSVSKPQDGDRAARKAIDRAHVAKGDHRVHTIKLAEMIDNVETLGERYPKFERVYMEEKRLLLTHLRDGQPDLYKRASNIVEAWFEETSGGDAVRERGVREW